MAQHPPLMKGVHALLHGGDYNPEQWLKQKDEIWKKDMVLAREAGINTLTVGIFSWAHLEPEEGKYDFTWLDEVMDMLSENGIAAILATPSGARPPWLAQKYPEVLRVNNERMHQLYGGRHNHCLTSPVYRQKVAAINEQLALRYGKHPAITMWHISNEYSGECHCALCQKAFQTWLQKRYGTIEYLNEAWWNQFWAHRFTSFDQIESPTSPSWLGENENHGQKLAWRRFTSQQHCNFYLNEIAPLKRITPDIPCTTNLMSTYPGIDYFALGKLLDRSSWDNYPVWTGTEQDAQTGAFTAFNHDLMRGVGGGKPFLMMESSPGPVNWQQVNALRRPGTVLLQGLQAVAHGSDSVQYFQFRKSRGSFEKFHSAVVDHVGNGDTRAFRDVVQVGEALKKLQEVAGSAPENKIALVYDWENRWALEDARFGLTDKGYEKTVRTHYDALYNAGFGVDIIDQTAVLSRYKVVSAPMCYMLREGFAGKVNDFVKAGGTFVLTYVSGYVNEEDLCYLGGFPGPLTDVAGLWAEEVDALFPGTKNSFVWQDKSYEASDFCELTHVKTARALASYGQDFYAGMPALTQNNFGAGRCYYIAARTGEDFLQDFYYYVAKEANVSPLLENIPQGIGVAKRIGEDGQEFLFVMNFLPEEITVTLQGQWQDMLAGKTVSGETRLVSRSTLVLSRKKVN
jgi:beta-galactosidase